MTLIIAPAARTDLEEIGVWIAQDSPKAAASFVDELLDACETLQAFPEKSFHGSKDDPSFAPGPMRATSSCIVPSHE